MRHTTRRGPRRVAALIGTAALATTVLVGCGGDGDDDGDEGGDGGSGSSQTEDADEEPFADLEATEVVDLGLETLDDAESLRIVGTVEEDGGEVELDVQVDREGSCTGTVGIFGGQMDVRAVDGQQWVRADAAFYEAISGGDPEAAVIIPQVADRWVIGETTDDLVEFCDVDALLDEFADGELDSAEKGEVVETDAGDALEVLGTSGGDDVVVQVLVDDPTYAVGFSGPGVELTGSDFDEPVEVEEPPADEVVDPAELGLG
ncbi:hypothetical protein RDV89_19810 [Nocardioides zeae]|uniref:Lipoprotein n=1 Tax=Nocardioides imazamoxiresistens TaxID=3231893 RepID=A0ABU3Q1F2_9ACTN|nr:hypothetical protein [Nocardioides zeae]MDT9595344.1 hypothetical protein [Nocardioides zeae]